MKYAHVHLPDGRERMVKTKELALSKNVIAQQPNSEISMAKMNQPPNSKQRNYW